MADTCKGLKYKGHVCAVGLSRGLKFHNSDIYKAAYPDLDLIVLDGRTGTQTGRRLAVKNAIEEFNPDIVIPVMLFDGLYETVRLKSRKNFKIVYPVHEVTTGVQRDIENYAAWMDAIVFVDNSGAEAFTRYIDDPNKSRLIPCGVPPATALVDRKVGDKLHIGYCGRLEDQHKRVLELVKLTEHLIKDDIQFKITIVGEGSSRQELERGLSALGSSADCTLLGPQPRDKLYQMFYPEIDLLVIFSEGETGPLVALEAHANGCIVLTSNFAGRAQNGYLESDRNALVFDIGEIDQAVRFIKKLIQQPALGRRLVAQGYISVKHKLLEESIEQWEQLILSLARNPVFKANKELPDSVSAKGTLDKFLRYPVLSELVRRFFGIRHQHDSIRSEWPFYSG